MKSTISLRYFNVQQLMTVAVIPLLIITFLVYLFLLPLINKNVGDQHHSLARTVAGNVTSHLQGAERQLLSIGTVLSQNNDFSDKVLTDIFDSACDKGNIYESIFIARKTDQIVSHIGLPRSRRSLRDDYLGVDVSGRTFQKSVRSDKPFSWSDTFLSTLSSHMAVAVSVPLSDRIIVGEITLEKLTEFIRDLPAVSNLRTTILDQTGRIIADSSLTNVGRKLNLVTLPSFRKSQSFTYRKFQLDGEEMVGSIVSIDDPGWKIIVSQPTLTAFSQKRAILTILVAGLVFGAISALAIALRQASMMSGLTAHYVNQAKSIARGDYSFQRKSSKMIEYNELADSLQLMASQICERETKLVAAERHMRTTLNSIGDGVITTDTEGVVTGLNPTAEKLTGWSHEVAIGKNLSTVFRSNSFSNGKTAEAPVDKILATSTTIECTDTTTLLSRTGEEYAISESAAPIHNSSGDIVGVVLVFRDVTDKERAKSERQKLEAQIEQSQKLEAVGRLAGGIAHDFNNLLTPILGFSDMLSSDSTIHDKAKKRLAHITQAALGARELVKQLLAFSRKQVMEQQPLNINRIVDGFTPLIRHTIRENIEIRIKKSPNLKPAMIDQGQIEQVLMNLVVNASDAMPEGGILTIETKMEPLYEADAAARPGVLPGDYVMLCISDTGVGIDEKTLTKIFEPFFSTKGKLGTGLGLATVYGIIKQHNGSVWVTSKPGKGTHFKLYLPVAEQLPHERHSEQEENLDNRGTETILLVEDNNAVRTTIHDILSEQGYNVFEADGGLSALEKLSKIDSPDLILTDVIMPDMDGKELFSHVSKRLPAAKVLYMSGYTDDVIDPYSMLKEGEGFMQKPFCSQTILQNVRALLDS